MRRILKRLSVIVNKAYQGLTTILRFIFLVVLSFFQIAGCAAKQATPSGFMEDYSALKPLPEDNQMLYYEKPNVDWQRYTKLLLEPVRVHYSPEAKKPDIPPEELQGLAEEFRTTVMEAVQDAYPVVDTPGPGVLRIRGAITDVTPTNPLVNIATTAAVLLPLYMGGAAMEAELLDSVTNERLAAIVDRRKGSPLDIVGGFTKWGHARAAFKKWAKDLREALDEVHGKE